MNYRINREESEEVVRKLAESYPKCFFVDPKMRRPLKNNILADLQKDGFPAAYELLSAGLHWYQSHFGYQYSLQAGARRIDLTGKEVSTVTEQEHARPEENQRRSAKARRAKFNERDPDDWPRCAAPVGLRTIN
jgi:sRNA-binding protein